MGNAWSGDRFGGLRNYHYRAAVDRSLESMLQRQSR
jgi:hypothetical protein